MTRRRKKRDSDQRGVGSSSLVPKYTNGNLFECPSERHERRKDTNLANRSVLEEFCRDHEIKFVIKNEGHHWQFRRGKILVEWWPSSAKLVVNKRWKQGIHVHDWEQARMQLRSAFGIKTT